MSVPVPCHSLVVSLPASPALPRSSVIRPSQPALRSSALKSTTRSRRLVVQPSAKAKNKLGADINDRIIALRLKHGNNYAEIARALGCSENYAKSIIHRTADAIFVFSCGKAS